MEQKKLNGVKGNPLSLAIPLQKTVFTSNGKVTEDYYPAEGSVVEVMLLGAYQRFTYEPVVEGNMVRITDKGTLPVGEYAVVTTVTEPDGTPRRSKWCNIVRIYDCTDAVLEEYEDFPEYGESEVLDGTVFIFAKGDPFTYDDFTEEQLADLKRPAEEAAATARLAAGVANQASREAREAAQDATDAASAADGAAADAQQAAAAANTAATNANEAADSAEEAAIIGSHPDYVGEDNYVYKYNMREDRYERTNIYVKGDKGDAGTTDYNLLENKPTRVSQFENDADYATESFVNSSIATATATYRGSYNLVTDLGLSVGASAADVSAALATSISDADNNDYCFVQIPVATDTPTVIARIDRYKHNGSGWLYEYTLNNSGFTAEQWDAINSGITSGDVDKLDALPTSAQLTSLLNGKQDTINDLGTIRSGASAGATAYQKPESGIPESDLSQEVKDKMNEKEVFVAEYGVTTWQEVSDAYDSKKAIFVYKDGRLIPLDRKLSSNNSFYFVSSIWFSTCYAYVLSTNNRWGDYSTFAMENSSNKKTSWSATPDNTHYPSEKLVKDSLDAKAGIGDVLFANFSNLTPKKTFEYDVSDTAYHPLFSRANTGISQLMSEVDDIVKFRITVTGTNIYARVDVVVRFQPALTEPCIIAWNEPKGATAANTGIMYLFSGIPKILNSGYAWTFEYNCYNSTTRHIKVEVFEDTDTITWYETNSASIYTPNHHTNTSQFLYIYRGLCANQTWYMTKAHTNEASYSNFINSHLDLWIAGTQPLAGEALVANLLGIMSGQKIYKATNKNIPIDCDCGVFLMASSVPVNTATTYSYIRQKISWTTLTGDPALTMDTFANGDQVYLRCTLGQDGKIYPDGHLSNVKSAGYTWVHIGTAASATAINLDTCGKPFITLNNDGKVTHINGTAVMDSSMSKWGVVSQTQTWTNDYGSYTLSDVTYGYIPKEFIDRWLMLVDVFGTFNETTGYFELNGLTDLCYKDAIRIANNYTINLNQEGWRPNQGANTEFEQFKARTTIPCKVTGGGVYPYLTWNIYLEVVRFCKNNLNFNAGQLIVYGNYRLRRILDRITISTASTLSFWYALEECYFSLKANLTASHSKYLSVESILYMIENVAVTTAITITLHPTAYARAIADSDVQAALQAHTNVSLASAT